MSGYGRNCFFTGQWELNRNNGTMGIIETHINIQADQKRRGNTEEY